LKNDVRVEMKYLLIILIALLPNCGKSSRNLSTPSKMIVGHWTTEGQFSVSNYCRRMDFFKYPISIKDTTAIEIPDGIYQVHLYIGPIDTVTNMGSYIYIAQKNKDTKIQGLFEYEITEEWVDWAEVKVSYWNNNGDTLGCSYKIRKDGKQMIPIVRTTPKYLNYLGDIQRFIFGVEGIGMMGEMIFKYVNNETKPSE
jgi:hypothetical protein